MQFIGVNQGVVRFFSMIQSYIEDKKLKRHALSLQEQLKRLYRLIDILQA